MSTTRRALLKSGVAAAIGIAFEGASAARGGAPGRSIQVTTTAADGRRMSSGEPIAWGVEGAADLPTVTVIPSELDQPVLGFGAAFTEASCVVINRLPENARLSLLKEILGGDGAALSVGRVCIGSSDYSTAVYSYDEGSGPDLEMTRFSIDHDRQWVLPVLKLARSIRPDLFLFGSPWSPPAWMKYGGSMLGGSIKQQYLEPYATYFMKYLEAYAAAGCALNAVTMQNELDADQDAKMPACTWSEEAEAFFIARHLGPQLHASKLKTALWIHDHNYDIAGRVMDQLIKPKVRRFVDAVAWHGYSGKPEQMGAVHSAHPDLPMHWTEGGPNFHDPAYQTEWARWSRTFADILRNGCRSITAWNVALDEKGGPNVGPFHCGGLVTVDSASGEITRSGMFWALAHYARFMQRGARTIGSHGEIEGVSHSAAINPDGSTVLVLTNGGNATRPVKLVCGGDQTTLSLPADAVVSLRWTS